MGFSTVFTWFVFLTVLLYEGQNTPGNGFSSIGNVVFAVSATLLDLFLSMTAFFFEQVQLLQVAVYLLLMGLFALSSLSDFAFDNVRAPHTYLQGSIAVLSVAWHAYWTIEMVYG